MFSWASRGNYLLEYLLTVNLRQPVPRDIVGTQPIRATYCPPSELITSKGGVPRGITLLYLKSGQFESRNACPEGYSHAPLQLAQRDRIDEAWTSYADDDVEVYCRHQMETTVQAPGRSTVEQRHGSVSGHPHGKIVDTEQHRSGWCRALDSQVKL